jgi:hypothetical protein
VWKTVATAEWVKSPAAPIIGTRTIIRTRTIIAPRTVVAWWWPVGIGIIGVGGVVAVPVVRRGDRPEFSRAWKEGRF